MPAEQSKGHPKLCSDIYAVGMVGIQALTGVWPNQLPTDPNTLEVIWQDRVSVSPKLAAILDKMVRYHFKERYPSASEALADINAQMTSPAPPTVPLSPPPPPQTPKLIWLAGIGLAIAAIAGIVILKFIPQSNLSPSPPNPKPSPTDKYIW
jgi:serine/threonine protein kinase